LICLYRSYGGGYGGGGGGGYGGGGSGPYGGGSNLGANLQNIDFSKEDLVPFEKNFYLEHPDVTKRSEKEAEEWRASKQIVVKGTDVPKPVMTFEEASMPEYILSEVRIMLACANRQLLVLDTTSLRLFYS
jgi:ATP-dependent RNA helicase DDX5/DBP2